MRQAQRFWSPAPCWAFCLHCPGICWAKRSACRRSALGGAASRPLCRTCCRSLKTASSNPLTRPAAWRLLSATRWGSANLMNGQAASCAAAKTTPCRRTCRCLKRRPGRTKKSHPARPCCGCLHCRMGKADGVCCPVGWRGWQVSMKTSRRCSMAAAVQMCGR